VRVRDNVTRAVAAFALDASRHADLSTSRALTLDLLNGTRAGRERVVEEFVFGSGVHARVISSYQCLLSGDLFRPHFDGSCCDSAALVLPLTTRPKAVLLDLDLKGPNGADALLVRRAETAECQTEQLLRLLEASPSSETMRPGLTRDLLAAICVFTPGRLREIADNYSYSWPLAIAQYLSDGLGLASTPSSHQVGQWLDELREPAAALAGALREPPDRTSSSENVLLALPDMVNAPPDVPAISALVTAFCASIAAAAQPEDEAFLSTLAEYGRRYEVLVALDVPVGERFAVRMAESRPLNRKRTRVTQRFALGDAASGHMEARVADHSVTFGALNVRDLAGKAIGLGVLNDARRTKESVSLYGSDEDRPYYVDVDVQLRLAGFIQWGMVLLAFLNFSAALAVFLVPHDGSYIGRLALLVVPTTLTAAVVLSRERTALANELQRWRRFFVGTSILVLWIALFVEVIAYNEPPDSQNQGGAVRNVGESTSLRVDSISRIDMAKAGAQRNQRVAAFVLEAASDKVRTSASGQAHATTRGSSSGQFRLLKQTGRFKSVRTER
jgi:hypothetical protein